MAEQQPLDLATELHRLNELLTKMSRRTSPGMAFFNGMLSGLGSFLGATIVVGFLVYLLSRIDLVPIIGGWLSQVANNALHNIQTTPTIFPNFK